MRIKLDDVWYSVNLGQVCDSILNAYTSFSNGNVKLGNKSMDFSKGSILRLGVKSAITPILLPLIQDMYEKQGWQLDKPAKHTDLIDYIIISTIEYFKKLQSESIIYATSKATEGDCRVIKTVSTVGGTVDNTESEPEYQEAET